MMVNKAEYSILADFQCYISPLSGLSEINEFCCLNKYDIQIGIMIPQLLNWW